MAIPVEVPKLGNTVEECLIAKWRKQKGERVAAGEIVAEIETDKATLRSRRPWTARCWRRSSMKAPWCRFSLTSSSSESRARASRLSARRRRAIRWPRGNGAVAGSTSVAES